MLKPTGSAVLLLFLAAVIFAGCQKAAPKVPAPSTTAPIQASDLPTETTARDSTGQLMATVDTLEEAQALAELYGIELVDFSYQIAVFRTDEDPRDVIRRGEEQGWPPLSLNSTGTIC